MTKVTLPSAAARTGVFCGAIKSTAFLSLPKCAGDEVLSISCSKSFGSGYFIFVVGAHFKDICSFFPVIYKSACYK